MNITAITMSDTPETDAHQRKPEMAHDHLWSDFARKLERERDALADAARKMLSVINYSDTTFAREEGWWSDEDAKAVEALLKTK